jgi:hypothetical protein
VAVVSTAREEIRVTKVLRIASAAKPDGQPAADSLGRRRLNTSSQFDLAVLHVGFQCHVTDSILVLEDGWTGDIGELLLHELLADDQLIADLMTGRGPSDPLDQIVSYALARGREAPPIVPGMDVEINRLGVAAHLYAEQCPLCTDGSSPGLWPGGQDGDPGSCGISWEGE